MRLKRVIHPIGQGGFYTETFINDEGKDIFNVIYDCGSETAKPGILSYLKNLYSKNSENKIDAVFISHLHDDHINGLNWLLNNTSVKYLFLPQLTYDIVIEAFLYNYIKSGNVDNDSNLCITSLLQNRYGIQIVEIPQGNENNGDAENYSLDEINGKKSIPSGTIITINIDAENSKKWEYIPFNSHVNSKKKLKNDPFFAPAIVNGKVNPNELRKLLEQKGVDACKEKYGECFGSNNHNSYSMTLFSGNENPDVYCITKGRYKYKPCYDSKTHKYYQNFLYTGDFEPNSISNCQNLKTVLNNRWDKILGIQVPHHGSWNNYNDDLYKYPCRCYISVGSRNKYKHPNVDTLANISKNGCRIIVVSEDIFSKQEEIYEL